IYHGLESSIPLNEGRYVELLESIVAHCGELIEWEEVTGKKRPRLSLRPIHESHLAATPEPVVIERYVPRRRGRKSVDRTTGSHLSTTAARVERTRTRSRANTSSDDEQSAEDMDASLTANSAYHASIRLPRSIANCLRTKLRVPSPDRLHYIM